MCQEVEGGTPDLINHFEFYDERHGPHDVAVRIGLCPSFQ